MAVLAVATPAGSTKLVLGGPTAPSALFIVGRNLLEAELCRAISVVGNTVTLEKPLASAKPAKCIVQPYDGGFIPWTWFGGRSGSTTAASDNVAAFNRLAQQIYAVAPGARIEVGVGTWYVNNQLRPDRDQGIKGHGPTASHITATADFPFDTTGEVAIIHPQRDGNPVTYSGTNTTRCFIEDLRVNGANVPNANGLLMKVQQPGACRNLRIDGCLGLYGLCVMGQDGSFVNTVIVGCQVPLRLRGAELMVFDDFNVEQTKGPANVVLENAPNNPVAMWNTFEHVHFERDKETIGFDIQGGATAFACRDLYYANPVTGTCFRFDTPQANPGSKCRYVLENIWCNTNSNTYKMVDDIQRGKSLNSFSETDRWIDYLTPRVLVAGYVKTP